MNKPRGILTNNYLRDNNNSRGVSRDIQTYARGHPDRDEIESAKVHGMGENLNGGIS